SAWREPSRSSGSVCTGEGWSKIFGISWTGAPRASPGRNRIILKAHFTTSQLRGSLREYKSTCTPASRAAAASTRSWS
ncbi:MAG: hypothetical protein ACK56F_30695, partial [bacterium]